MLRRSVYSASTSAMTSSLRLYRSSTIMIPSARHFWSFVSACGREGATEGQCGARPEGGKRSQGSVQEKDPPSARQPLLPASGMRTREFSPFTSGFSMCTGGWHTDASFQVRVWTRAPLQRAGEVGAKGAVCPGRREGGLCPATVSLTASARVNGNYNRQQPPPTALATSSNRLPNRCWGRLQ